MNNNTSIFKNESDQFIARSSDGAARGLRIHASLAALTLLVAGALISNPVDAQGVSVEFDRDVQDHRSIHRGWGSWYRNDGYDSRYDDRGNYRHEYRGIGRAVERLEESGDRFRDAVKRLGRYRHGKRAKTLRHHADRYEQLTDSLRDEVRRGRTGRGQKRHLLGELYRTGKSIDYLVTKYPHQHELTRRWNRTEQDLFAIYNLVGINPHHVWNNGYASGGGYNHYGNNGYNYGNSYSNGYGDKNHGYGNGYNEGHGAINQAFQNHTNKPYRPKAPSGQNARHAADIIEDSSERTKNAYRHYVRNTRGIAHHGWVRDLDGALSAFDQAANQLRDAVRGGHSRATRLKAYHKVMSHRARVDSLMGNRTVGHDTRRHWRSVVNAIGQLSNTFG